jgi:hypothetical protein
VQHQIHCYPLNLCQPQKPKPIILLLYIKIQEREEPKDAYPSEQSIHHSQQQEEGAITLSFTPSKKFRTK